MGMSAHLSHNINKNPMPLFRDGKVKDDRIAQTVYIKALRDSSRQRWCLVEVFDISKAVKRETTLPGLIQEVNEKAGQLSSSVSYVHLSH